MQLLQTKVSKVLGGMLCGTVEALVLPHENPFCNLLTTNCLKTQLNYHVLLPQCVSHQLHFWLI